MIGVIVITHGHFGQELLRTAQDIIGRQEATASLSVTAESGMDQLKLALDEALSKLHTPEGTLIFVDMLGGSPCNAALPRAKDIPAEVITGVNLYMLISAFRNRGTMDLDTLASRVVEDGKKSVLLAKDLLLKRIR